MNFEDEASEDFEVLVDDNYPGQFRVVGSKIEKVSVLYAGVCICRYCVPELLFFKYIIDAYTYVFSIPIYPRWPQF